MTRQQLTAKKLLSSQAGFSFVETLIALGVSLIVMSGLVIGTYFIRKMSNTVQIRSTEEKQITQIIENIRSSVEKYQITYDDTEDARNKLLDIAVLPMAWNATTVTSKDLCKDCPGRFGFVIQPFQGMRGLYVVTVRLTHTDWAEVSKDFQFVVSVR
ncbi:MAG: hypothetical protein ACK5P7_12070 [Bdellovibrio sp.]|jgi:hypothetical protein